MLYIATVHVKSPRWIPIQKRELERNIGVPSVTWASIEGIDRSYEAHFDHVVDCSGGHAEKLNRLACEISDRAADDDLLMFLDGDAFPIADPMPLIEKSLTEAPMLAVRRKENAGDPQPHPCFCVTRIVTWRDLPGDWSEGFTWTGPRGAPVTDPGANLLRQLELTGTPWVEILRSNRHNPHPVLFGVYGGVIYHHGAGFRWPFTRSDVKQLVSVESLPEGPAVRRAGERNRMLSESVFERIQCDEPGWKSEFI